MREQAERRFIAAPGILRNHGSFFRISTHSVWMMERAGISVRDVEDRYDNLNFASTILSLTGHAERSAVF